MNMADIFEKKDIEQFVNDGFVRIDNAFSSEIAEEAVDILWKDIPFDRLTPSSWVEPVVRLGMYTQRPFIDSVNTERLYAAYDELTAPHRRMRWRTVGAFPIRLPSEKQPNDTGKHVDASFPGDNSDNYFEWRVNVRSKGRALLMLVLYSDVNESDAPTVI